MTIIELPLWMVIIFIVCFLILFIHTLVGDFLGKIIYQHFKEEEKDKYEKIAQFLEWYKKYKENQPQESKTNIVHEDVHPTGNETHTGRGGA